MLDNYKDEGEELLGDVVKMESFHPVMQTYPPSFRAGNEADLGFLKRNQQFI